ncbi:MAG: GHKL domain-containing protein [Lachnospiraceae bacterium]|nr:GHKL domain-containing protein [Lachnospiraceae bacterium]
MNNGFVTEAIYLVFTVFLQICIAEYCYPAGKIKKRLPLILIYGFLTSSVLFMVNRFQLKYAFFIYVILSFVFTLFWFIAFHPGFCFHKFLTALISCATIIMTKSLVSSVALMAPVTETVILIILDLITAFVIVKNRIKKRNEVQKSFTPYAWVSVLLVVITFSGIAAIFYTMMTSMFNPAPGWHFPLFFIATELLIYVMLSKVTNEYNGRIYYSTLVEQQRYQPDISRVHYEKMEEIRLMRHEIKNKAFYMKELIDRQDYEALKNYLSEEFSFPDNEKEFITGNDIMDSVLSFKKSEAEKQNIRFSVTSTPFTTDGIEERDLTPLLFNLLDNSINAQEKVKDKWIDVNIRMVKGYLCINVENSTSEDVMATNPDLVSKREGHGLGLRIVRSIIDKYNGMVSFISSSNTFKAEVMLMINT